MTAEVTTTRTYAIEDGALVAVPVYEPHKRGKNWLAVIAADPAAPGGLARTFQPQGRGRYYYLTGGLRAGQAIEFGADYYSGGGGKSSTRWYGVVLGVTGDTLTVEQCATSKEALARGKFLAATPVDRVALLAERDTLTARLAEIDGLLA